MHPGAVVNLTCGLILCVENVVDACDWVINKGRLRRISCGSKLSHHRDRLLVSRTTFAVPVDRRGVLANYPVTAGECLYAFADRLCRIGRALDELSINAHFSRNE